MSQAQGSAKAASKKSSKTRAGRDLAAAPGPKGASSPMVKPAAQDTSSGEEQGDLVTELWLRFGRYGWDVLGVGLIAFALLTLVGIINRKSLLGLSNGVLLTAWVGGVTQAFGWGWPLIVIGIGALGLVSLRQRGSGAPRIALGRVLALEAVAFAFLAFLTIWNGWSLERVSAGEDGGWVGWGLATILSQVLPDPWGAIFLVILMIILGAYGTGFLSWSFHRLESWLNAVNPAGASNPGSVQAAEARTASAAAASEEDEEPEPGPGAAGSPAARNPNLPPLSLLLNEESIRPDDAYIQEIALKIEATLAEFGVPAKVVGYRVGPTVTQYAVEPGFTDKTGPDGDIIKQKVRVSQISALSRDLALSLSAERLRIEAPVPGRTYLGIEVPNPANMLVRLRPLLETDSFKNLSSPLAIALGRDVSGQAVVADLARMPHLLIAGTTGSGKSVCIGAIVTCLVMNNEPSDLRLALLDPKMVELVRFNGLPHLFGRVETEIDRMLGVLRWAIMEMERRYRLLEEARARDINVYNRKMAKRLQPRLPRIVLLIDELADLMMTAPDQTEHSLIRLAQMARATGIHLVVATQRPSTDVVTGLIKANFPARLAFTVASSIDSRVILDLNGAESLLGKGDMLFLNPESGTPQRAQGVLIADEEIEEVASFWKQKLAMQGPVASEAAPWEEVIENSEGDEDSDALVEQAIKIVRETQRASTSLIQRRLRVGYPRAARLMDQLEELGVVGPSMGGGREREVLASPEEDEPGDDGAAHDSTTGNSLPKDGSSQSSGTGGASSPT